MHKDLGAVSLSEDGYLVQLELAYIASFIEFLQLHEAETIPSTTIGFSGSHGAQALCMRQGFSREEP